MRKLLAVTAMIMLLGGCATTINGDPVGVGRGANDLKESPCACIEIPMNRGQIG